MGYPSRGVAVREQNEPIRKKCVAVNKVEWSWISEAHFDIRHGDTEFGVCPVGFALALVQYFLIMLPSLKFGIAMNILCNYILEVCDLLF